MLNALMYMHTLLREGLAKRLHLDDRGVTSVEYALLVVLLVFVMGLGAVLLGGGLSTIFSKTGSTVGGATVPSP
ncbi:MAG TPA: Flp family type IVb pilin [Actinobacteria bacterium]|nr:Flp family type IVb pilin [Actinomycetota bacterium]